MCASHAARYAASVYAPVDAADTQSAKPFCAAPIYPVQSMRLPEGHTGSRRNLLGANPDIATQNAYSPDQTQPEHPVPHFLCHAEDDRTVPVANTLMLREALKSRGGSVDTHLFSEGGHGFGLRGARGKPCAIWPELWLGWAQRMGLAGPA